MRSYPKIKIFITLVILYSNSCIGETMNSLDLNSIDNRQNIIEVNLLQRFNNKRKTINKEPNYKNKNYLLSSFGLRYFLGLNKNYFFDISINDVENGNIFMKSGEAKILGFNLIVSEKEFFKDSWLPYVKFNFQNLHKMRLSCIETKDYIIGSTNSNCFSNSKNIYNYIDPVSYNSNLLKIEAGLSKTIQYYNEKTVFRVGIQNKFLNNKVNYNSNLENFGINLKSEFGQSSTWQEQAIILELKKVFLARKNLSIGFGLDTKKDFNKTGGDDLKGNIRALSKINYRLTKNSFISLGMDYNLNENKNFNMSNYNFFETKNKQSFYLNFGYINNPRNKQKFLEIPKIKNEEINNNIINKQSNINKKTKKILEIKDKNQYSSLKNYALEVARKFDKI